MVPVGALSLTVAASAVGSDDDPAEVPEQLAFTDTSPSTTQEGKPNETATDVEPTTTVGPTTQPPTTSTNSTTSPKTLPELSEGQARIAAFHILARQEFPLIDLALETDSLTTADLDKMGEAICEVASDSDQEGFVLAIAVVWSGLEDSTKLMFNNDIEDFSRFNGFAMGAFCPGEYERMVNE